MLTKPLLNRIFYKRKSVLWVTSPFKDYTSV